MTVNESALKKRKWESKLEAASRTARWKPQWWHKEVGKLRATFERFRRTLEKPRSERLQESIELFKGDDTEDRVSRAALAYLRTKKTIDVDPSLCPGAPLKDAYRIDQIPRKALDKTAGEARKLLIIAGETVPLWRVMKKMKSSNISQRLDAL